MTASTAPAVLSHRAPGVLATRPEVLAQHLAECLTGRRSHQSAHDGRAALAVRTAVGRLTTTEHPRVEQVRVIRQGKDIRHVTAHLLADGRRLVLGFTVTSIGHVADLRVLRGGEHVRH